VQLHNYGGDFFREGFGLKPPFEIPRSATDSLFSLPTAGPVSHLQTPLPQMDWLSNCNMSQLISMTDIICTMQNYQPHKEKWLCG